MEKLRKVIRYCPRCGSENLQSVQISFSVNGISPPQDFTYTCLDCGCTFTVKADA